MGNCSGSQNAPEDGKANGKRQPLIKNTAKNFKVVLLGDVFVGKSSIAKRYCENQFDDKYMVTLGGVYQNKKVKLATGEEAQLHIWDTTGQERYRSIAPMYYRDATAALLVYDVTSASTFKSLDYWIKELKEKILVEKLVVAIVGNKCDVETKAVSPQEGTELALKNNFIFTETSAKTGQGVQELFTSIIERLSELQASQTPQQGSPSSDLK